MNIVVIGQGAIGLLWYHHLSKITCSLKLLHSRRSANIPKTVSFINTNHQHEQSACNIAQLQDLQEADLILCCVKAFDVKQALAPVIENSNKHATIILCHNGLGVIEQLPTAWFADTNNMHRAWLAMLTTHGAKRIAPFSIQHTGAGQSDLGLITGSLEHARQKQLINLLNQALPSVYWQDNIKQKQWQKLAINCVINPLTAIDNVNNGAINQPTYANSCNEILKEVVAVSKTQANIELNIDSLINEVQRVAKATEGNISSMRADILANRPTEIAAINGYICQLGKMYNIGTTKNEQIVQQVLNLSAQA